jgi:hypothetical protein
MSSHSAHRVSLFASSDFAALGSASGGALQVHPLTHSCERSLSLQPAPIDRKPHKAVCGNARIKRVQAIRVREKPEAGARERSSEHTLLSRERRRDERRDRRSPTRPRLSVSSLCNLLTWQVLADLAAAITRIPELLGARTEEDSPVPGEFSRASRRQTLQPSMRMASAEASLEPRSRRRAMSTHEPSRAAIRFDPSCI